jgi:hypothetical protein
MNSIRERKKEKEKRKNDQISHKTYNTLVVKFKKIIPSREKDSFNTRKSNQSLSKKCGIENGEE